MHAAVACAVAALATYLLTPLAIRLAVRTGFSTLPPDTRATATRRRTSGDGDRAGNRVSAAAVTGGLP